MQKEKVIVVVAGASGTLGKLVCDALVARGAREGRPVHVRALVRRKPGQASTAEDRVPEGANVFTVPVDYDNPEELQRACAEAHAVVSTLQGLEDVIVGVQSRLLDAAIATGVRRFIPSDFSGDFTKLPEGSHRNFDLRRRFHRVAEARTRAAGSAIELTSIFQGGFTELLGSGWVLFDYKKQRINYFGDADAPMEFTTWQNTAEFTAAALLDARSTPRYLFPAGQRATPREAQAIARRVTGAEFALNRVMPTGLLRIVITVMKFLKPGNKDEVMPLWVALQYGYCGALGVMSPDALDNDRYPDIVWTSIDDTIRTAFVEAGGQPQIGRAHV